MKLKMKLIKAKIKIKKIQKERNQTLLNEILFFSLHFKLSVKDIRKRFS